jgi:aminoglycoside 3-N-acetyltransferase
MDTADVPLITPSHLAAGFRTLGIATGQTLLLHASVNAVGYLLGGPRVILETLLDLIAPGGTLMMLANWEGNPYRMEQWPAAQRAACLAECPVFDPMTAPADHRDLSILAEYLRTWPGAYRSAHPLASFVAGGAQARWLTAAQPFH